MAKSTNPLLAAMQMHTNREKEIDINGTKVVVHYRLLTLSESDSFTKRMIKDFGKDGKDATIDFDEAAAIKYEKLALCLQEPTAMTVKDLEALPLDAIAAFNEIAELIEPKALLDDEGNLKS